MHTKSYSYPKVCSDIEREAQDGETSPGILVGNKVEVGLCFAETAEAES